MENPMNDYIGIRTSTVVKKKIEEFALKNNMTVSILMNVAVLKHMGEIDEVNKILEKAIKKK